MSTHRWYSVRCKLCQRMFYGGTAENIAYQLGLHLKHKHGMTTNRATDLARKYIYDQSEGRIVIA